MDDEDTCQDSVCPVHCTVSDWGAYGNCSHTCGRGLRVRSRDITQHPNSEGYICPALYMQQECNPHSCPIDCKVSHWGAFSGCTSTCGKDAERSRSRVSVIAPMFGGQPCPDLDHTETCTDNPECPIDCQWSTWTTWQNCSVSCGVGQEERSRYRQTIAQHNGIACVGATKQTQACGMTSDGVITNPCPVHCAVSDWGSWGTCSQSCTFETIVIHNDSRIQHVGSQTRSRSVITEALHGGAICPSKQQTRQCNDTPCPRDCVPDVWGSWDNFAGGGGLVTRSRTILTQAYNGGRSCEPLDEQKQWHEVLNCTKQDVYGMWSDCSRACGGGHRYRFRRHIICSSQAVVKMHMDFRQGVVCNTRPCGVGETSPTVQPTVPALPTSDGSAAVSISPTQLSEELTAADGTWIQHWH